MKNIFKRGKVFFIAEMSANHNNDISIAKKIIKSASKAGIDAIKFQTFTADEMTLNLKTKHYTINESKSLWNGNRLYDLYKKSALNWKWHDELFKYSKKNGLIPFSTPFGEKSLNFLRSLNVGLFKVASLESSHFPLLKKLSETKKPLILSTGATTEKNLVESVKYLKKQNCKDLTLLKCTSTYPTNSSDLNLLAIPYLKKKFKCRVGFSDHSMGINASLSAVALGAEVIEKHIKLDDKIKSVDSKFSITVDELKELVQKTLEVKKTLGKKYFLTNSEKYAFKRRRSIIAVQSIDKGQKFTLSNIKVLRPNIGLHPKYYDFLIGKKSQKKFKIGAPISYKIKK